MNSIKTYFLVFCILFSIGSVLAQIETEGTKKKGKSSRFEEEKANVIKPRENPGSYNKDSTKFYYSMCDAKEQNCAIYVAKVASGQIGEGQKLNENINKGKWNAEPYVSSNADTLFFISKRIGGKGFRDVWISTCSGDDNWSVPVNPGSPVNSTANEMSPHYYSGEKVLFFSSMRDKGMGKYDIYIAKGDNFQIVNNIGGPFNTTGDDYFYALDGLGKEFFSSAGKKKTEGTSADTEAEKSQAKLAEQRLADSLKAVQDAAAAQESAVAMISNDSLAQNKTISIEGKVVVDSTNKPASDINLVLSDENNKALKSTETDEKGKFKYDNISGNQDYKISLEDTSKNKDLSIESVKVKVVDSQTGKVLFENIYFDFNKFSLRPEAEKVLDELNDYYKDHSEIQIEINANTDATGPSEYNKRLSKNRGKAAQKYLINRGVKKTSFVIKASGEEKPLASNKTRIGRQLNRRVEFNLVGANDYQSTAMIYIIEANMNLSKVAKKFDMTEGELKGLNKLVNKLLRPFRPLRVKRSGDNIIAPATVEQMKKTEAALGSPVTKQEGDYYIVEPKNTLYSIGKAYGLTVEQLKIINGLEDDKILIGQKLRTKAIFPHKGPKYAVQKGDTMYSIARRFGLTVPQLQEMNGLSDTTIRVNMVLKIKK